MAAGAPSSWRPPWFETMTASAPRLTARRASSGCKMPFTTRLPCHLSRNQPMSRQLADGSNCRFTDAPNAAAPLPSPAGRFPHRNRGYRAKPYDQPGCASPDASARAVTRGGMVKPLRRSRSRNPARGTSSVSTSTVMPAPRARRSMSATRSRSFQMYIWNHSGPLAAAATSSTRQEAIAATTETEPAWCSAWASATSPPGCSSPVSPIGAPSSGRETGSPSTVVAVSTRDTSTSTRGASSMARSAARLRAAVTSSPAAPST